MKTDKQIPLHRSAGFKITACIIGAFALLAVALELVFEDGLGRITTRLVAAQVDAEVEFVGTLLGPQVAFEQQQGATNTLQRMVENSHEAISRVVIVDAEGEPFASWGEGELQSLYDLAASGEITGDARTAVSRLTLPNGTSVGAIAVEWTTRHIAELRGAIQRRVILATILAGLLATGLVIVGFRFIVSKPLSRLATAVERLRQKDYDFAVSDAGRRDEFGILSQSVESFRKDLSNAAKLEERARETNAAFDATSAPLMVANADGLIRAVNPAASSLMSKYRDAIVKMVPGFDPANLVGQPLQQFHPHDHGSILDRVGAAPVCTRLKFGEGRIELNIQTIHTPERRIAGFVLEWQDVTDEFRNSSRIDALERTQLCAEFGPEGSLRSCNATFRKAIGSGAVNLADVIRGAGPDGRKGKEIVEHVSKGENLDGLFLLSTANGKTIFVEGSVNVMRDIDDTIHRLFLFARDVTEAQTDLELAHAERTQSETERNQVVEALRTGMSKLAEGNLDAKIDDRFADRFEELRADYNDTVQMLQQALKDISEQAAKMREETKDISTTTEVLSQRSESTAATLEQTAAALDQLTGGVKSAAESAREASLIVSDAREGAERSGGIVVRTVKAMDQIAASSEKVSSIIKVIDDIAFQTNLLALNAGVEAARAGDAGRGFAVVASEVRALAQRSSDAASEINTLIEQSSTQVKSGVVLVGETGEALQQIVGWVTDISDRVVQIAESAKEQSATLDDINSAVTQLDGATQQNAARLEETTAASEALRNNASSLVEAIHRFKIPTETAGRTTPTSMLEVKTPQSSILKTRGSNIHPKQAAETWTDF